VKKTPAQSQQERSLARPPPRSDSAARSLVGSSVSLFLMPLLALGLGVAAEMGVSDREGTPIGLRVASYFVAVSWIGDLRRRRRALRVARLGTLYHGVIKKIDAQRWANFTVEGAFGTAYCGTLSGASELKEGDCVPVLRDRATGDTGVFAEEHLVMENPPRGTRLMAIAGLTVLGLVLVFLWTESSA